MNVNRMVRKYAARALILGMAVSAGCDSLATDRILAIDAEGIVFVFLYRDDNLNGVYNATGDTLLIGQHVDLQMTGALNRIRGGATDSNGIRVFRVPVGRYNARVADSVLGDSLEVVPGVTDFTVAVNDSVLANLAVAYHVVSVAEARALPRGRKAWVSGTVMNSPNVFGDSTVHLIGDSVGVRTTGLRPGLPVIAGDSVLFLGRRTVRDGQPVVEVVSTVIRGTVSPPAPDSLSTVAASNADGGKRDARLAKVFAATVSDTATVNGVQNLTVNDGTGALRVVLSANINFGNFSQYRPGSLLDITGLLVPDATTPGIWVLKPRARQDIVILP